LWVLPRYARQGFGRVMLDHARQLASMNGARSIAIDADPNAEPFYLACGARRQGEVAAPIDGQPHRIRPQLVLDTGH
ncbi:MAG: GNAT family N-acetyltransferase, partial [Burkholderiaceae bacterium]